MTRALPCLLAVWVLVAPDEPPNLTDSLRATLEHGRSLLGEGDRESALGHFEGARLSRPCLVWLDLSQAPGWRLAELRLAAREAFSLWNDAFPDELDFRETEDERQAQIKIRFVPEARQSAERTVAGHIEVQAPHVGKRVVQGFTAYVAFQAWDGQSPRSRSSLVHVVAHELGHAIGVGDSPDRADIMGPDSAQPSVLLSAKDRAAVRELLDTIRRLIESARDRPR